MGHKALDHPDGTRTCTVCNDRKPLEHFDTDKNATLGHRSQCKPCRSEKMKAWYAANRQRQAARQKNRRVVNPERLRQQDRERYYRDRPKRIALVEASGHERRARMRQAPSDTGITKRRLRLRLRDGDYCCYCGVVMDFTPAKGRGFVPLRATIEHVTPLSVGGSHTWDNVALCCWQCNQRKNKKTADEWVPTKLALSA